MTSQSWLVLFLVVIVASVCHSLSENEIAKDDDSKVLFKKDPKIPMAADPRFNKMLPLVKLTEAEATATPSAATTAKAEKASKKSTTDKSVVKDETSTIGNKTCCHNSPKI